MRAFQIKGSPFWFQPAGCIDGHSIVELVYGKGKKHFVQTGTDASSLIEYSRYMKYHKK